MGFKDWFTGLGDTIEGGWNDLKGQIVDGGKTWQETWDTFKNEAEELFVKGCEGLSGTKSQAGCCQIKNVIKCNEDTIKRVLENIKDETTDVFNKGCVEVGGTVKDNTCTVESFSVSNGLQSDAGATQVCH